MTWACMPRSRSSRSGVSRQRASGLRRHVPVPEQGASISTPSAFAIQSESISRSRPGLSRRLSTIVTPARSARGASRCRRARSISQASSAPRLSIAAPICNVLPPAPAQRSTSHSPGCGASAAPTNWLPSSCTSISPARYRSDCSIGVPLGSRSPKGASGVGVESGHSASTASRVVAKLLIRTC